MIDHRMKIYHFSKKILSIHVFFVFFHQTSYIFQSIISPQIYQFINFPFIPRLSSKFRDWIDYEDRFEMKENLEERSKRKKKTFRSTHLLLRFMPRTSHSSPPLLLSASPRNQFRTRRSIGRSIEQRSPNFPLGLLATDSKRLAPRGAPTFREESGRSRRLLFSSISSEEPNTHGRATRQPPHKGSKKTIQSPRGLRPESRLLRSRLTQRLVSLSVYERERKNLRRKKVENSILESRRARASCECMGGRGGGGEEQSIKEKKTRP